MLGAGGHDERVVREVGAIVERTVRASGSMLDGLGQQDARVLLLAQDETQRLGDVGGREGAGRDLVQERAEEVVVAAIDERDVRRRPGQGPGGVEAAVAAADDQYAMSLSHLPDSSSSRACPCSRVCIRRACHVAAPPAG